MIANILDGLHPAPQQHPLSAAFPAMREDAFVALKDSIEVIGVQNPIVLFEDMVLDGWHRCQAALDLRCACPAVHLAEGIDPRDYVIAQNERRRHLSASQIADAIVRVHGWRSVGRPNNTAPGAVFNQAPGSTVAKTNAEIAEQAGVSERTIRQAKFVQTHAEPEIQDAVRSGEVSLKTAAAVAKLPAKEQQAAAVAGPEAIKVVARKSAPKAAKQASEQVATAPGDQAGEVAELREQLADLAGQFKETLAENAAMGKVFDADDQLAAAAAEVKRLNALVSVQDSRLTGMTNELNECKRLLKAAQRRAERAEAALKEREAGNAK